jgi:thiamine pyrophosphate-dependent acetolactate synthase large subunit-like protein
METKTKITGAHAFMQALVAEGVDTIFGYPGGAIMPVSMLFTITINI